MIVRLQVTCNTNVSDSLKVLRRATERNINLREYDDGAVSVMYEYVMYFV